MVDNISAMISNKDVIDRIDSLLKIRHLKRNAIYDALGLAHNTFTNWSKEDVKLPAQSLFEISKYFNVSIEWLLTGAEDERIETAPAIPQEIIDTAYEINALPEVYKKIILDTLHTLKRSASEKEKEEMRSSSAG